MTLHEVIQHLEFVFDKYGDIPLVDLFVDFDGDQHYRPLESVVLFPGDKAHPPRLVLASGDTEWMDND